MPVRTTLASSDKVWWDAAPLSILTENISPSLRKLPAQIRAPPRLTSFILPRVAPRNPLIVSSQFTFTLGRFRFSRGRLARRREKNCSNSLAWANLPALGCFVEYASVALVTAMPRRSPPALRSLPLRRSRPGYQGSFTSRLSFQRVRLSLPRRLSEETL